MQVLIVNSSDRALPEGMAALVREGGWESAEASSYDEALKHAKTGSIDAVILAEPSAYTNPAERTAAFDDLLHTLDAKRIAGVLITDRIGLDGQPPGSLIDRVGPGVSAGELRGRFAMIRRYRSQIQAAEAEVGRIQAKQDQVLAAAVRAQAEAETRCIDAELEHARAEAQIRHMESVSKRMAQHFSEVDEEMGLAGRLQQDFLPKLDKPIGPAQFAALYRPATWVSGDLFDVFPIDEKHTGFYIADAVGHGMAAGLLTMFIKRALSTAHASCRNNLASTPSDALAQLNQALLDQNLPQCQFVTAWYGMINHETLALHHARGGHPHPFLISRQGATRKLKSTGSLLGVFETGKFVTDTIETQLHHGDKLLLFTDGAEMAYSGSTTDKDPGGALFRQVESAAKLSINPMLAQLEASLPTTTDPHVPRDDVSMLGLEILTSRTPLPQSAAEIELNRMPLLSNSADPSARSLGSSRLAQHNPARSKLTNGS